MLWKVIKLYKYINYSLYSNNFFFKIYKQGAFIETYYHFFNESIMYDITNEEPARFFEKIVRIRIIDKILYPLI